MSPIYILYILLVNLQNLIKYRYFFLLVPDAPPTLNSFTNVRTTSFTINWSPPPPQSQNGVITMYAIDITGDLFPFTGSSIRHPTDGSYPGVTDISLEIIGLEEYNDYTVRIAAVNSEGTGPYSMSGTQQTLESGDQSFN